MSAWLARSNTGLYDSLTNLQGMSVHEFLKLQMGTRAGKPTAPCKKFVAHNCDKLLEIALTPADGEFSKRAFFLLTTSSHKAVEALLQNDAFFMKATEILASRDADPLVISRLSAILGHILVEHKSSVTECVCFVMQLLKYVEDPSVFSLFCLILDSGSTVKEIPALLARSNFASLVLSEFENADQDKLANLVAIVRLCLKHRVLGPSFRNERVLNGLIRLMNGSDMLVLNQAWQAIGALCVDSMASKMTNLLGVALAILEHSSEFHMYHVFACDFIGKLVYYTPGSIGSEGKKRVIAVVIDLMERYPNNTNLMGSVFRIIRSGVKNSAFLQEVMNKIVPLLVGYAGAKERTARAANATQFIADMEESRTNNRAVDQTLKTDKSYCQFRISLAKYLALLKKEYGGPVAKYVKKSRSWDNNLAPQAVKAA